MLTLLLAVLTLAPPLDPVGMEIHHSGCASGGFDHFFFEGGLVLAKCWGCESRPHVMKGAWAREGRRFASSTMRSGSASVAGRWWRWRP